MFLHIYLFYKTRYYTTQLDIAFYHKHNTRRERAFKKNLHNKSTGHRPT